MQPVFADTSFYLAILNPADAGFAAATRWSSEHRAQVITTEYVMLELANALARSRSRKQGARFIEWLYRDPHTSVVPSSPSLFERGLEHYANRPDKEWSLTDCISFVVMSERGIAGALTTDHHFVQAGFQSLLAPHR